MYGGWYIACLRNGRTVALMLGPTKTADDLPSIDTAKLNAMATEIHAFEPWPNELYEKVFFLAQTLHMGAVNKKAWLSITKEPWNPN